MIFPLQHSITAKDGNFGRLQSKDSWQMEQVSSLWISDDFSAHRYLLRMCFLTYLMPLLLLIRHTLVPSCSATVTRNKLQLRKSAIRTRRKVSIAFSGSLSLCRPLQYSMSSLRSAKLGISAIAGTLISRDVAHLSKKLARNGISWI